MVAIDLHIEKASLTERESLGCTSSDDDVEQVPLNDLNDQTSSDHTTSKHGELCMGVLLPIVQRTIHHLKSKWLILLAGQVLSFFMAGRGAAQGVLALHCNLSAPTFTIGLYFFALSFCLVPLFLEGRRLHMHQPVQVSQIDETELSTLDDSDSSQSDDDDYKHGNNALHSTTQPPQFTLFGVIPLQAHAFTYLPMALLDVYGNYFTVMALKLTTLTSVSLFDALAIPSAMILSRLFLNRRYTTLHFLGVLACSVGIGLNVMQDYAVDVNDVLKTDYPNMIQGDLLAILAGFMFGVSNVLGEVAVRSMGGPNEYLGMVGFWGTVICAIQTLVIEQDEVAEFFGKSGNKSKTCGESLAWWLFTAYWATSVLSYLGTARFLQVSEATFFNLSLLTGDLWSVAFSVVAEKIVPKPAFFVALVFTVAGVVLYEMAPSPILEDRIDQAPRETQHDATAFETEEDSAEIQLTGVKYE